MVYEKDKKALAYSGLMGHEFIVVRDDSAGPSVRAETNSLNRAVQESKPGDRVYRQLPRRKWALVE